MTLVIVERRFDAPASMTELQAKENSGAWCLDLHGVTFVQSYFSADRKRMMCLYDAPDAESVRLAQTKIGMPFDQVWSAELFDPFARGLDLSPFAG